MNLIGDTIEDSDKEIEQKDVNIELLENKVGIPNAKVIEEKNRLRLNKKSSKRKCDGIMDRMNISLNNHNYIKNKKQKN